VRSVLGAICTQAGIDVADAELVLHSINAVYRLSRVGVILRLSEGRRPPQPATRFVRVATEFKNREVPVIRLAPAIDQPIQVDAWAATAWTLLPDAIVRAIPSIRLNRPGFRGGSIP
jgi:hypothetical protein